MDHWSHLFPLDDTIISSPIFFVNAAFGPPDEMANVLVERISKEDRRNYLRSQHRKRIFAAVLAILFAVYVTYVLFWKQRPIIVVDHIIIETTATEE